MAVENLNKLNIKIGTKDNYIAKKDSLGPNDVVNIPLATEFADNDTSTLAGFYVSDIFVPTITGTLGASTIPWSAQKTVKDGNSFCLSSHELVNTNSLTVAEQNDSKDSTYPLIFTIKDAPDAAGYSDTLWGMENIRTTKINAKTGKLTVRNQNSGTVDLGVETVRSW